MSRRFGSIAGAFRSKHVVMHAGPAWCERAVRKRLGRLGMGASSLNLGIIIIDGSPARRLARHFCCSAQPPRVDQ